MHAVIGLVFIGILASLGSALFYMVSPSARNSAASMATALTFRISLSVGLFGLLMLLWAVGAIEPHGLTR